MRADGRFVMGLRARATLGFGATALLVAIGLATLTYEVARSYLVEQRESTAVRQAYVNARLVRTVLRNPDPDVPAFLAGLGGGTASSSVLRFKGEWFSTSVAVGSGSLPPGLVKAVGDGSAGRQRFAASQGGRQLAVGVPVAAVGASYFEVFPLAELERTLDLLARALLIGVGAAAVAAAVIGRAAANQLVRPLGPVADAAEKIAAGALDTRLDELADPDLAKLSHAFNTMAIALEQRMEREARFAADVSHELRSPLTAVAAAIEIIERRRDQLPAQVTEAFSVLAQKVAMFQQMVLDLLEISRMDAGTAPLSADVIGTAHFVEKLGALHGVARSVIAVDAEVPTHFTADRRRLGQAIGNLLDNAERYAGGVTAVRVSLSDDKTLRFTIDDRGPGVPVDERSAIFGRFARGAAGLEKGSSSGTGLGLALVAEHVRLHHGTVAVDENPDGGARFVVEVPLVASTD